MAEYIEREAALEIINSLNIASALCAGRKIINLPPADVAPVRHGRWEARAIPRSDPDGDWIALEYHCSLCNRLEYRKENYCPHCGAKMDLEG